MLTTTCPHCGGQFRIEEKHVGEEVICLQCETTFTAYEDSMDSVEPAPEDLESRFAGAVPAETSFNPGPGWKPTDTIADGGIYCITCGYNLSGVRIGGTCPECGTAINQSLVARERLPLSSAAVASMVLGIISLALCPCFAIPSVICGPLALVFGFLGLQASKSGRYSEHSKGFAIWGLVLGSIACFIGFGFFFYYFSVLY